MANASTVRRQVAGTQQLTIASLLGSTITTTKTAFQLNNNGLTLTGGGVIPLSAGVTGLYAGTGQVLHFAATGTVSGATVSTTTMILYVYQIPAALLPIADTLAGAQTFTGWNLVWESDAGSARTLSQAKTSWSVDVRLQLDAAGNLNGEGTSQIDSLVDVYTGIPGSGSPAAITGLVGEADLNFVVAVTLGGAETGVVVTADEIRLDLE